MYINKVKVMSYHYPYKNGKESKTLEVESTLDTKRGMMIKKIIPLLDEYEETLEIQAERLEDKKKEVVEEVEETPKSELNKMTKIQLEEFAREFGVELDRREKKETLVKQAYKAQFDG